MLRVIVCALVIAMIMPAYGMVFDGTKLAYPGYPPCGARNLQGKLHKIIFQFPLLTRFYLFYSSEVRLEILAF